MRLSKLVYISVSIIAAAIVLFSCSYKKDVIATPCVLPDVVSYSANIAPIIAANCSDCHSAASPSSGILLDNYDGLNFYAQNGYLYGTISHASGYKPMPDGGAKLNDCTIATIKKWIDNGTPR
ncbi:MAG: hypothetical protein QM726_03720 [Chitinophagaceae bacterium]